MDNRRQIFISTASQILVRLTGLIVSLVSVKLLTQNFGLSGTGIYNTVTTYLTFSIVLADLGLFSASVREIAKAPEREREIIGNVLTIRLITAAMATAIAGLLVLVTHSPELVRGVEITCSFIFFNLVASAYDISFQYRLKMQLSAFAELISKLIALVGLYIAIRLNLGFGWALASIPLSGIAIFLSKSLLCRSIILLKPAWDSNVIRWILRISLPLGAVFILNNLYFKVDTLILFALKGAAAVGIYSVAYKVLEVTIFIGSYFASSLKPSLARGLSNSSEQLGQLVQRSIIIMLILSLPISVVTSIFARPIILFLSNSHFLTGVPVLILLGWTLPFIYCDVLLTEVLIAKDTRRTLFWIAGSILSFNIIADLLVIPHYSYYGAALATLISEAVLLVINILCCRRFISLRIQIGDLGKVFLATLIASLVGLLIHRTSVYFLVGIAVTFAAYFATVFSVQLISVKSLKSLLTPQL